MDIENLSLEELMGFHYKILKRIHQLRKMKLYEDLQKFDVGDRVSFKGRGEDILTGTVIRVNQKSLSIKTDQGTMWYVSPALATKIELPKKENSDNLSRVVQTKWSEN
jgi:preprotein translocase subunit YajC